MSVFETSFGARKERLIWSLSTQSPDPLHFFSEKVDYGKKINEKQIKNDSFKAFIYEIPKDLDVFDEKNWILANPGLHSIISVDYVRKLSKEAQDLPSKENKFRQLICNQRVDANEAFITRAVWMGNKKAPREDLEGESCYIGLDLSSKIDLTAIVLIFPDDKDPPHFDVLPFFWKPEEGLVAAEKKDKVPYTLWEREGYLLTTPGKTIALDYVAQKLVELTEQYEVKKIYYDRWKIDDLMRELEKLGYEDLPFEPCGQGFKDQSPCVDILESMLVEKRLRHGGHPVLTWNIANAVVDIDPAGLRKMTKRKSFGRIDGAISLGQALRIWELCDIVESDSIYDNHDLMKKWGQMLG
jgi:phage terminase large subunit-like protein